MHGIFLLYIMHKYITISENNYYSIDIIKIKQFRNGR